MYIYVALQVLVKLIKFKMVEQEIWVQSPLTPKTNWCLSMIIKSYYSE